MDDHIVPDLWDETTRLVFCGTALGARSAAARAYYAHPGNRFWKALHAHGFTPHRVDPAAYPCVAQWGIGLTDMCKTASGNDDEIPPETYDSDRLRQKIEALQPDIVAFTSKEAARQFLRLNATGKIPYGFLDRTIGRTRLYVLPSPSGHAAKYWNDGVWAELSKIVKNG